jgi:hypothetical protein
VSGYAEFLAAKAQLAHPGGFEPLWLPDFLFDFQKHLTDWAIRHGRSALFEDCGLGKTPQQLVWAENVRRKTNRPVLILTPLAVSGQTVSEGEKFGIEVTRSRAGEITNGINVTNYERLHHYTASDFGGVVCDESSILKSFAGATRKAITEFMRVAPYRLLCTATAAPNDYFELGTSSEALGHMGFMDMLGMYFKNSRNNAAMREGYGRHGNAAQPVWHFRGHAEQPFWRWVISWARAMQKPSDAGFDDGPFKLPALHENRHLVKAVTPREGMLFSVPAIGLREEREERRRTLLERCEMVASLVNGTGKPAVCWCHLNDEGDELARVIPDGVQVSGKDSDDEKEEKFAGFTSGKVRVLITKPIIGAWGMNWQHCAHMVTFSGHSFEQYYQSVRRFWRYGQTNEVTVDHVLSDGEERVLANLQRKAEQAQKMFAALTRRVSEEIAAQKPAKLTQKEKVPAWL